ncbi:Protein pleiotropic regulatory locus 1 [Acorus calamus]|uniref:Protein pleiotropic regulatory locus 1 n=1 Tax=Acorus calamus TaxID=4465 RepID=A0AAV9F436_ACOCL|nr:Protein pleiotropic regulatory locus 1 [Acorus calamus]
MFVVKVDRQFVKALEALVKFARRTQTSNYTELLKDNCIRDAHQLGLVKIVLGRANPGAEDQASISSQLALPAPPKLEEYKKINRISGSTADDDTLSRLDADNGMHRKEGVQNEIVVAPLAQQKGKSGTAGPSKRLPGPIISLQGSSESQSVFHATIWRTEDQLNHFLMSEENAAMLSYYTQRRVVSIRNLIRIGSSWVNQFFYASIAARKASNSIRKVKLPDGKFSSESDELSKQLPRCGRFTKLGGYITLGLLDSEASVYALSYDISGSRLITCEADKTIKMWKKDETAILSTLATCKKGSQGFKVFTNRKA